LVLGMIMVVGIKRSGSSTQMNILFQEGGADTHGVSSLIW
jgi:hypothetical protein